MAERAGVLVAFFVATWLTGLSLATAFAAAAYGFGRSVEPERTDLISLAIFGVMGLASQAGLLLAPWASTRGLTSRIIAALLMGPAGETFHFEIDAFRKHGLLTGQDEVEMTLAQLPAIEAFEARRRDEMPWLG